jgi:NADH-quinone oxidoreductase subunit E
MIAQFSQEKLNKVNELMSRYPQGKEKSALLPVLHMAQQEFGGWLDVSIMDYVASLLQIQPVEVYEVATFYSMYNLKPVGKYVFEVCQTGPCMVSGSDNIINYIQQKLNKSIGSEILHIWLNVNWLGADGFLVLLNSPSWFMENKPKASRILLFPAFGSPIKTLILLHFSIF